MYKKKRVLLFLLVISFLLYQYPIQKFLAQREFENYTNKQGIVSDNIRSKEIFKDWKLGGYLIVVSFNNDENNKYYYCYQPWTHKKEESFKLNTMTLDVIDEKNSILLDYPYDGKCKYPPIQE